MLLLCSNWSCLSGCLRVCPTTCPPLPCYDMNPASFCHSSPWPRDHLLSELWTLWSVAGEKSTTVSIPVTVASQSSRPRFCHWSQRRSPQHPCWGRGTKDVLWEQNTICLQQLTDSAWLLLSSHQLQEGVREQVPIRGNIWGVPAQILLELGDNKNNVIPHLLSMCCRMRTAVPMCDWWLKTCKL